MCAARSQEMLVPALVFRSSCASMMFEKVATTKLLRVLMYLSGVNENNVDLERTEDSLTGDK